MFFRVALFFDAEFEFDSHCLNLCSCPTIKKTTELQKLGLVNTFSERHEDLGDFRGCAAMMKLDQKGELWFPVYFISIHNRKVEWRECKISM